MATGGNAPRKRTVMEYASQVALFVGALAMVGVGGGNPWGFVIAFVIQPFWYYTAVFNRQWGLLGASTVSTVAWILGIYNHWVVLCDDVVQFLTTITAGLF